MFIYQQSMQVSVNSALQDKFNHIQHYKSLLENDFNGKKFHDNFIGSTCDKAEYATFNRLNRNIKHQNFFSNMYYQIRSSHIGFSIGNEHDKQQVYIFSEHSLLF